MNADLSADTVTDGAATRRPVLLEVGARFGLRERPWAEVVDSGAVRCYLIEPDPEECRRLRRKHPRALVRQVALGAETGPRPFYVTRHPAVASLRRPNWDLLGQYAIRSWFEIERTTDIHVSRIDELIEAGELEPFDFLHVDVQGFELEVLRGAGNHLRHATGLKLELHPVPLYAGESSLFEVGSWLAELGFRMIGLQQQGPYEADFVEANCFFVNRGQARTPERRRFEELFVERHGLRPAGQPELDIAHVHRRLREVEAEKLKDSQN
ncbi:FkbM family methyltransferase [Streptomyces sp. NPDC046939]|uniref:FkbM family methyltransferase n=1 Tax=Streptomyces sp. NPDC046939 TaxID=3155376 RepID=UPI0033F97E3C